MKIVNCEFEGSLCYRDEPLYLFLQSFVVGVLALVVHCYRYYYYTQYSEEPRSYTFSRGISVTVYRGESSASTDFVYLQQLHM